MNIKNELVKISEELSGNIHLNDIDIDASKIKAIMINEVVPDDYLQDFYGGKSANYMKTTIPLFQRAGVQVNSINEILSMGIYITNAVKTPKLDYAVEKSSIEESLPLLEKEIELFPNLKVIMLMGDVAKKAFNMIAKKNTKKNVVPSTSTYKLQTSEIYYGNIRVLPSYIMTGGNILIEKSKFEMAAKGISVMVDLIK